VEETWRRPFLTTIFSAPPEFKISISAYVKLAGTGFVNGGIHRSQRRRTPLSR
jgi:hypothetical protein